MKPKSILIIALACLLSSTVTAETKIYGSATYSNNNTSVRISTGNDHVFMYNGYEQKRYRPHGDRYGWTKPYRPNHQNYNNNYNYRNACKVKYVRRQGNVTEIYCE